MLDVLISLVVVSHMFTYIRTDTIVRFNTCNLHYVHYTSINLFQNKFPKVIQLINPSLALDATHLNIPFYYKADIIVPIL